MNHNDGNKNDNDDINFGEMFSHTTTTVINLIRKFTNLLLQPFFSFDKKGERRKEGKKGRGVLFWLLSLLSFYFQFLFLFSVFLNAKEIRNFCHIYYNKTQQQVICFI